MRAWKAPAQLTSVANAMHDFGTDVGMTETSRQDMKWAHRQRHEPAAARMYHTVQVFTVKMARWSGADTFLNGRTIGNQG